MNIEEQAIRYLFQSEPETTFCVPAIIKTLGLRGKTAKRLGPMLREMVRSGELIEKRRGYYHAGVGVGILSGKLRMTRSGAAIVTDDESGKTVFVESGDVGKAIQGDRVTVSYRPGARTDPVGVIQKIDEEAVRDVVGTVRVAGDLYYVSPLNPIYRGDFALADPKDAKDGDRVVVRVRRGAENRLSAELLEVIGPEDKPSLDTIAIMRQYELPESFPPEVLSESEKVASLLHNPGTRLDLRDRFILTIDPLTARDFDDAISLEHDEQGNRVLGVHIADVSHFVRPGSALDKEAFHRNTSVYLIDRVIPMLPEQLSNGVCSLQPNEDRLAFSAFLTYDKNGKVIAKSFAKSLIRSKQRLAYEEAFALMMDSPVTIADAPLDPRTVPMLKETLDLTRQLKKIRERNASLELASQEVDIVLDKDGRMTGIHQASNDESHQLIECCMVAANEAVAEELLTHQVNILSRLHEAPDDEKIAKLEMELRKLGIRPRDLREPKELALLLRETADHPLKYHIHALILRSLKRAIYSAKQHGHFGLALTYYSHFTSPIRRYPDLVLHRQLIDYLVQGGHGGRLDQGVLDRAAARATEREQIADEAERALTEIKKYRFLQQQLDERKLVEYNAVVVSVKPFGFFVDVVELQISGMVHISNVSNAFVRFDPTTERLHAGQLTIKTGMSLKVYIAKVDFPARRLDFVYVQGSAVDTWNGDTHAEENRLSAVSRKHGGKRGLGHSNAPRTGGVRPRRETSTAATKPPLLFERPDRVKGVEDRIAKKRGFSPLATAKNVKKAHAVVAIKEHSVSQERAVTPARPRKAAVKKDATVALTHSHKASTKTQNSNAPTRSRKVPVNADPIAAPMRSRKGATSKKQPPTP
ncbi:MAG: VacB/RNase II family 3'-5' exoribonuclease [Kiritimatiellia bacterium]